MSEPESPTTDRPTAESSGTERRWLTVAIALVSIAIVIVAAWLFFRPAVVPDVKLMPVAQATVVLENAGLSVGETSDLATGAVGPGLVARQSPTPLSKVTRRSSVDLTIAVTPTLSKVPAVIGLDAAAAATKLVDALYLTQVVDIFDEQLERGSVVEQAPSEGTEWLTGRPVAIAVAAGPDDGTGVAVPDVQGAAPAEAVKALQKAGLGDYGILADPSSVASSKVVRQMPSAGVLVRPGTTVLLLFDVQ